MVIRTPETEAHNHRRGEEPPPLDPPVEPLDLSDEDVLGPLGADEAPEGPTAAEQPGLWTRVREQLALRRVLSRAHRDDVVDGVEIVSGAGAPVRLGRSRAELARRRSEALRPAQMAATPIPPAGPLSVPPARVTVWPSADSPRPDQKEGSGRSKPERFITGRQSSFPEPAGAGEAPPPAMGDEINRPVLPGLLGQLPPPARPSSLPGRAIPLEPPGPPGPFPQSSRSARGEPDTAPAAALSSPRREGYAGRLGRRRVPGMHRAHKTAGEWAESSPSEAREARRLLALFGGGVAVMFVVGLASGRSTLPLPAAQTNPAPYPSAAPSAAASSQQPATSSPANPRSSAPASKPGQPQLSGVQVFGNGGTGWQIQSIRYGAHAGYVRMVFDLGPVGTSTGTPKITIGTTDPTTMLVVFDGVLPAGSTGSVPPKTSLSSVMLLLPSPFSGSTVYELKLTHPVTATPNYTASPVRLVLDIPN